MRYFIAKQVFWKSHNIMFRTGIILELIGFKTLLGSFWQHSQASTSRYTIKKTIKIFNLVMAKVVITCSKTVGCDFDTRREFNIYFYIEATIVGIKKILT